MYKFPAFKRKDGRILIDRFWYHFGLMLADPKNKTEYNVWQQFRQRTDTFEEVDLMDYPKLVPHMIPIVKDWWLKIQHKNQVFEWLLTKGVSEVNAEYACNTVNKEAKEWYLKYLKDRGRLW